MFNGTCTWMYPSTFIIWIQKVAGVINIIYAPIIITANVLFIASMIATKQSLTKSSNFLIVCLSCSDCLIGAILMPLQCVENFWYDFNEICLLKRIAAFVQLYFCGMSMSMTMLLALDRYLHMNPNFQNPPSKLAKLFKRPKIYFTVFGSCLFQVVVSFAIHLTTKHFPNTIMLFVSFFCIFMVFSITLVAAIYTRGYLRIRRYVAENPIYANRGEASESPEYLNALFKTVLILLIVIIISWLPILAYSTFLACTKFGKTASLERRTLLKKTSFLLFNFNSAINAVIIFYRNEKSRKWLRELVSFCCRPRNNEQAADIFVVHCNNRITGSILPRTVMYELETM